MTKLHLSAVAAVTAADQDDDVPTIHLNETDSARFIDTLENPPSPPNAALRLALARARERYLG